MYCEFLCWEIHRNGNSCTLLHNNIAARKGGTSVYKSTSLFNSLGNTDVDIRFLITPENTKLLITGN